MVSAAGDIGAPLKETENNAPAVAKAEQPHAATVEDVDDVPDPDEDDLDDLDGRRLPERAG
jgi:peroxin-19